MKIELVDQIEYEKHNLDEYTVFHNPTFNESNRHKCANLFYFLFVDSKTRLGLIAGKVNNKLVSPFSAPFGGFVSRRDTNVKIKIIDDAILELDRLALKLNVDEIIITNPPSIYNENFINQITNSLLRNQYGINYIDLNHYFPLQIMNENYRDILWYNARKNLKICIGNNLEFKKCQNLIEKEKAYQIIKMNRLQKNFPLKLTLQELLEYEKFISIDYFLVSSGNDAIGGAVVYQVNLRTIQVIYWGDNIEFSNLKTMNFLSYKIFEYYKKLDFDFVDIGPSTEMGKPNYGLCEFKESIGCKIATKITFSKKQK